MTQLQASSIYSGDAHHLVEVSRAVLAHHRAHSCGTNQQTAKRSKYTPAGPAGSSERIHQLQEEFALDGQRIY